MPTISPQTALLAGWIVAPSLFALSAYFARAGARRIVGALAGALTYGAVNLAFDQVAIGLGWWRYPGWSARGQAPLILYWFAGLVSGGAFGLLGWRMTRRFGARGLTLFVVGWTVWGLLHDLGGSLAFASSNLMVFGPGIVPALADAVLYATCWLLAYAAMRLVAGPASQDALRNTHHAASVA